MNISWVCPDVFYGLTLYGEFHPKIEQLLSTPVTLPVLLGALYRHVFLLKYQLKMQPYLLIIQLNEYK